MTTHSTASISDALMRARRTAAVQSGFPGDVPATLDAAYAVQFRSMAHWPDQVVGFKVGGIPPQFRTAYPSPWIAGPVFSEGVHYLIDGAADIPVFAGGFAAFEAELILELTGWQDIDAPITTTAEALAYVDKVYLGAEIASSPMPMVNALGPGSIISDFGNNEAMIIGPEIDKDWLGRFDELDVSLSIDGAPIGRATPKPDQDGPLGALMFLLNHLRENKDAFRDHGITLPERIWLTSGAITGVHETQVGATSVMDYAPLGTITLTLTPRGPRDLRQSS